MDEVGDVGGEGNKLGAKLPGDIAQVSVPSIGRKVSRIGFNFSVAAMMSECAK